MNVKYEFLFKNDRIETIELTFNKDTLSMEPFPIENNPPWTQLACKQCKVCTLKAEEHSYCPVARNLSYVLLKFRNDVSHNKATIRVTTADRITEKEATMEEGVSSIMGLIMATSGCPILDKFKPMAFIHLPFSNEIETILRAISMYFVGQYLRSKKNLAPDWGLKNFNAMYAKVNQVNIDFSERVRQIPGRDANINALILLDFFAQVGTFEFSDAWMKQIEPYFDAYLSG
jgi:hypothetical protein